MQNMRKYVWQNADDNIQRKRNLVSYEPIWQHIRLPINITAVIKLPILEATKRQINAPIR